MKLAHIVLRPPWRTTPVRSAEQRPLLCQRPRDLLSDREGFYPRGVVSIFTYASVYGRMVHFSLSTRVDVATILFSRGEKES
jgi:hypothetical protein